MNIHETEKNSAIWPRIEEHEKDWPGVLNKVTLSVHREKSMKHYSEPFNKKYEIKCVFHN